MTPPIERPNWINIVRDPIERIVSEYYYSQQKVQWKIFPINRLACLFAIVFFVKKNLIGYNIPENSEIAVSELHLLVPIRENFCVNIYQKWLKIGLELFYCNYSEKFCLKTRQTSAS